MLSFLQIWSNLMPITLVQGLLYALVAVGVMIPFRVLNLPDLSSEGVLPLGGCVAAALLVAGLHPVAATAAAVACGFAAGALTATIHLRFKVHSLLAGILTITMLWSVNLRVLGKPNTSVFGLPSLYDWVHPAIIASLPLQMAFFAAVLLGLLALLYWGLHTEVGLGLRGVGANSQLAPALGINVVTYTVAGLGLANGFTALAGALLVQNQGYADVGMGFGMLVNGLASVIIGEALTGRRTLLAQLGAPVIGAIVYYQLSSLALAIGLAPSDLKMATALFVLATIGWPLLMRSAK
ncbi:MAG: ABC transporter permease [Lautropia sp.]